MTKTDTAVTSKPASGRNRWNATDLGLIAVFAALVAGSALIAAIPVGGLGVPITLQTLAVILTGLASGTRPGVRRRRTVHIARIGRAAHLQRRPQRPRNPCRTVRRLHHRLPAGRRRRGLADHHCAPPNLEVPGAVPVRCRHGHAALSLVHGLGVLGMMVNAKLDLQKAFLLDLAYYPGDIIKNVLAVSIALALHKAFPDLLIRRPGVRNRGTAQAGN